MFLIWIFFSSFSFLPTAELLSSEYDACARVYPQLIYSAVNMTYMRKCLPTAELVSSEYDACARIDPQLIYSAVNMAHAHVSTHSWVTKQWIWRMRTCLPTADLPSSEYDACARVYPQLSYKAVKRTYAQVSYANMTYAHVHVISLLNYLWQ